MWRRGRSDSHSKSDTFYPVAGFQIEVEPCELQVVGVFCSSNSLGEQFRINANLAQPHTSHTIGRARLYAPWPRISWPCDSEVHLGLLAMLNL